MLLCWGTTKKKLLVRTDGLRSHAQPRAFHDVRPASYQTHASAGQSVVAKSVFSFLPVLRSSLGTSWCGGGPPGHGASCAAARPETLSLYTPPNCPQIWRLGNLLGCPWAPLCAASGSCLGTVGPPHPSLHLKLFVWFVHAPICNRRHDAVPRQRVLMAARSARPRASFVLPTSVLNAGEPGQAVNDSAWQELPPGPQHGMVPFAASVCVAIVF